MNRNSKTKELAKKIRLRRKLTAEQMEEILTSTYRAGNEIIRNGIVEDLDNDEFVYPTIMIPYLGKLYASRGKKSRRKDSLINRKNKKLRQDEHVSIDEGLQSNT